MIANVLGLARHQDVSVLSAVADLSMFLGAGLLPLLAVWYFDRRSVKWIYVLWAPCVLYVGVLAVNYSLQQPLAGAARLLLWVTIAVLFIRESGKLKTA